MNQTSNSLLGKAVRSRRDLHNIGNILLDEQESMLSTIRSQSQEIASSERARHQQENSQDSFQAANYGHHTNQTSGRSYESDARHQSMASDEWVPLLNPRQLVQAVMNSKKLIAIMSLCGLLVGMLFAFSMPKYYYSTAEILIDPRELQISDRGLLPTGLPYDASLALVENQTRILTSRRVILGTVEKLNLDQDDEFNGNGLGTPGPIEVLQSIAFGRDSDDSAKAKELAVENLQIATTASRTPKTFVINLTIRSQNAEKAALIANTMAEVYIGVQDEIQSDTVGRANGELGSRLEELRTDVEKAERLVEAYRSENDLFDANGKLISDDEIALSSTQLTRARERVAEMRARADSARELTLDAVLSDALPEGAASTLIAELRRGYAQKVQQRDALAEQLGAQHPQLRTAEAEVSSAKRGIEIELRRLSQTAQIELQRAIKTEQDLAAGQARLKTKKSSISESLVRLRELEREAGARRSVYEAFLLRARETGQQAGISTANTTIVSQAVPPLRTYGTSRKLIAVGGLIGGFMFGLALAVMGALWRALTQVDEYIEMNDTGNAQLPARSAASLNAPPPNDPRPSGSGNRPHGQEFTERENANHNPKPNQGDSMYYPYPYAAQQNSMMNGMMVPAVPQPMMQPQIMPQMPYGYPMMQQPMMQQPMMPQYAYGHPQMMQPVLQQPMMQQPMMQQPIIQPVYVAAPQQPVYQPAPVYQSAPVAAPPAAPAQNELDYMEIRGRLQSLRDGIVNLADGRQRFAKLG